VSEVRVYQREEQDLSLNISARGHHVVYRANEMNRCPGCGRAHWYIGRQTAECGFCGTAIALAEANWIGPGKAGVLSTSERSRYAPKGVTSAAANRSGGAEQRRYSRKSAGGRRLQLLIDDCPHAFAIHNISEGGLMGDDPIGLEPGISVQVRLEDGTLMPATVKWTEGSLIGLAFIHLEDN